MKKKKQKDVFDFEYFDAEEKELIESINESFDKGEWKSIQTPEVKKYYQKVARNTPKDYHGEEKDAEVFMLEDDTIRKLKSKAKKEGISYQDLASSVLQKFANS